MKQNTLFRTRHARWLLMVVGLLMCTNLTWGQGGPLKVTGTIKDSQTQEPLIGASVVVKGTTTGVMTNADGNFEIMATQGATLAVSYIGYTSREVVAGTTAMLITLEEATEQLDEVVVIGYGQVRKGDATGALLSVKPDQLNKGLQVTAEDAMVGKIAGVNVVPGSGAPGDEGTIRIRMGASLKASNDPMIVIDGIPVQGTSISAINPNDIASFTVLKDASATAIYGSRASNGVIIITTKKGSADGNQKPHVSYSANFSASQVFDYIDVLQGDEYRQVFAQHANAPAGFELGDANTDWQKEVYRTGFGTDHNLSMTGAALNTPYRVSLGYNNLNGIVLNNNYQRYNIGVGLTPQLLDKHLKLDINFKGSVERERPGDAGQVSGAVSFDPTRPVHYNNPGDVGLGYFMWMDGDKPRGMAATNPVANLLLPDKLNRTNRIITNILATYKIHGFEDVALNVNAGLDNKFRNNTSVTPNNAPSTWTGNQKDGTGVDWWEKKANRNTLIDLYANYNKDIGQHHVDAMGGYGWQHFWEDWSNHQTDLEGNEFPGWVPNQGEQELYLLSFFGRANYSYAGKYMLTATLRGDASSRFAPENRWGYFPSLAVAWKANQENFLKDITTLSDLRVRASYGKTGQQDAGSYYQHLSTYSMSYNNARYLFGDKWVTLYRPNGYDPNITWETTATYNAGIDYGFIKNRITGSVDVYKRYTTDLLNEIDVPAGSNFTNMIYTNVGDMESEGVELALNGVLVTNRDWEWTLSGNFTWNNATITKLNTMDSEDKFIRTATVDRGFYQIHKVGLTPNTFFLLRQAYDENGSPIDGKYLDKDGNITGDDSEKNRYVTNKSSRAPYFYGLSTRVMYKNFDLGLNGHGSFGNYVFNYQKASKSFKSLYGDGVSSNIPRSVLETNFTDARYFSDHFLESATFFRLDNITLGYNFVKPVKFISDLRVSASVQNVFTITNYSGIDPEIYDGLDRNIYQRPRIFMLGVNLNF